ncbi:MAG: FkbM family methyltransferase [Candidatus Omnitrophota bacterium]
MNVFIGREFDSYYEDLPLVLVDAGARGGLQKNWKRAGKHLNVIGFEPDAAEFARLSASQPRGFKYINTALYSRKARIRLFLTRNRGVSSVYRPDTVFLERFPEKERYDITDTVEVDAEPLDAVLASNGIYDADFLKLDTQGSELDILQGASGLVGDKLFGIEVEAETVPVYEGQPLLADVDAFIRSKGYFLFDIKPFYWKRSAGAFYGYAKGQIIFADLLYLRKPESLASVISGIPDKIVRKSKVMKTVSVCILYGYLDYAAEIFGSFDGMFDSEEKKVFGRAIRRSVAIAKVMPGFKGRGRLADAIHAVYRMVHPEAKGWVKQGRSLGNTE